MFKSKIVGYLRILNNKEITELQKVVAGSFYSNNEQTKKLFKLLYNHYPLFDSKDLSKSKIVIKLFPNHIATIKQLNYRISELISITESYLLYNYFKTDNNTGDLILIKILYKNNLKVIANNLAQNKIRSLKRNQEDEESNYLQYQLQMLLYNNRDFPLKKGKQTLQKIDNQLELFYIKTKLNLIAESYNRKTILGDSDMIQYNKQLLTDIKHNSFYNSQVIKFYYHIIRSNEESRFSISIYHQLKKIFIITSQATAQDKSTILFTFLSNYLAQLNFRNYDEFLFELYSLTLLAEKSNCIVINDTIDDVQYLNYIRYKIAVNKIKESKEFIDKYQGFLAPNKKYSAHQLSLAIYYYYSNKYEKCLQILSSTYFKNFEWHRIAVTLLVQIYFMTKKDDLFYQTLKSFDAFVRRQKNMSKNYISSTLNYLSFIKQLFKLKYYTVGNPSLLYNRINKSQNLYSKKWLLDQIAQLN